MILSKKELIMAALALGLGGLYLVYFTGWCQPKIIHIESTARSLREAWYSNGKRADSTGRPAESVTFAFLKNFRLTSVCVFSLDNADASGNNHTLWHLVSKSGSQPVNGLAYGTPVAGMNDFLSAFPAEPLQPGGHYRLIVEAGVYKGTNDFTLPLSNSGKR